MVAGEGGDGGEEDFEGESGGVWGEEEVVVDEGEDWPVPEVEGVGETAEVGGWG